MPFLSCQHRLHRRAGVGGVARRRADRRFGRGQEGQPADRHHRRVPAETPTISAPAQRQVQQQTSPASSTARPQRLTDAGVNKIILSLHLQDTPQRARGRRQKLKNVDIVISGGADDLVGQPGRPARPGAERSGPFRPRTRWSSRTATGKDIPLVTTQGEYRYLGRLTVHVRRGRQPRVPPTRRSPARSASPRTPADLRRGRGRDAEGAGSPIRWWPTRPTSRPTRSAPARCCSTVATRTRSASRKPNLGDLVADGFLAAANRTAVADGRPWRMSRSPTAAASATRSRRATSPRRARSTCCRSTT